MVYGSGARKPKRPHPENPDEAACLGVFDYFGLLIISASFRSARKARTRAARFPGSVLMDRPGMTRVG
jgi:hypothetical protein